MLFNRIIWRILFISYKHKIDYFNARREDGNIWKISRREKKHELARNAARESWAGISKWFLINRWVWVEYGHDGSFSQCAPEKDDTDLCEWIFKTDIFIQNLYLVLFWNPSYLPCVWIYQYVFITREILNLYSLSTHGIRIYKNPWYLSIFASIC